MDFCLRQLVTDLLPGSYGENGVMDFGESCYSEVANLLRTCYGETGILDFGLYQAHYIVTINRCRKIDS